MQESLLEIAVACVRRGWHVFPCWPGKKEPRIRGGNLSASNDEEQVRKWWTKWPDANVGISTRPSRLSIVDCDHGNQSAEDFQAWTAAAGLPETYTVRTGRRDGFGVQLYYSTPGEDPAPSMAWDEGSHSGDIRGSWGYVMAAGCLHPSGDRYTVLVDAPIAAVPSVVRTLKKAVPKGRDGKPNPAWMDDGTDIVGHRNCHMISLLGRKRGQGADDDAIREYAVEVNDARFRPPLDESELDYLIRQACKFPVGAPDPVVIIGGKPSPGAGIAEPVDWRTLFHTRDEVINCPPPTFLIDQFLARQAICAIAAPVAQRKSLIALNVARSLCTGEPLFGFLPVLNRPSRVLYLCPEMGLVSLSDRIRRIGLGDCLGNSLFLRSMNMKALELLDIPEAALDGSVLIIDTAIRFLKGDENSSKDMQFFSDTLFTVQRRQGRDGAIMALYHSPKATKDVSELTLENCMRGSGELGAAITDAHGTRLQNPTDPYNSASFLRHIKCRDYKGIDDFEFSGNLETGVLTKTTDAGVKAVLSAKTGGNKANRDGRDGAAKAIIQANPDMTIAALIVKLKEAGIERKKSWVGDARMEIRGSGCKLTVE